MCGIVGVISDNVKNKGEFYEFMSNLLYQAEIRGVDATGFAALADGKFVTDKLDVDAENFVRLSEDWRGLHGSKSISMIGHTRAATNGSPSDNKNNHPFHGPRFSMIHNGGIWNHERIAWMNGFNLQTKCDSEVILHFLEGADDEEKGVIRAFEELDYSGWFAVSFMNREDGSINLFREKHSPCVLYKIPRWNALVFASTADIILAAMEPIFDGKYMGKRYLQPVFENDEIPEDAHVKLNIKKLKVDYEDLQGKLDYNAANTYSRGVTVSSSDTSAFSGGASTWDAKPSSDGKCLECGQYIESLPGAMHEVGAEFMCNSCYTGETDFGVSKSSVSDLEKQEDKDILEIISGIAPIELRSAYGTNLGLILERLLKHREPLDDVGLSENEQINYIDVTGQELQKKLVSWSETRLSNIFEMGDGEYLSYVETISEALSLVTNE